MNTGIFDKTLRKVGLQRIADSIHPFQGEFHIKITRADGRVEEKVLKNVVTRKGLNRIANRAVNAVAGSSPFFYIGIGTQTAAHSLDSVQAGVGEVLRKSSNFTGTNAQSCEWIFLQCTVGGFSDSMTFGTLDTVFLSDFQNSHASTGIIGACTNGLAVTLANSDLLDVTYRIRVGSHNLGHTT